MHAKKFSPRLLAIAVLLAGQSNLVQAAAVRTIAGITAKTLPANDDGSTAAVNIGFTVNFFGVTKTTLFVNNNGNVTFNSALGAFTPTGISTTVNQPMIAPFFADVDTRGTGSGLVQYGNGTLCGRTVFGVNWINVGYYPSRVDKLNSFQLLLIDRSDTGAGNFDIEMNYDAIKWETGGASGGTNGLGGTSAEAGYTNGLTGMARVSYQFPGSRVNGALLDTGPNALIKGKVAANTAGRYHFYVRNGVVTVPTNQATDISSTTKIYLPLRYVYQNGIYSGQVTLARTGGVGGGNTTAGCLDETGTTTTSLTPVTVIILQLPPNVTLPGTLVTSAGYPYITIPSSTLEPGQSLRFSLHLRNPNRVNLGTYFIGRGYRFRIIAGPFDPTMY